MVEGRAHNFQNKHYAEKLRKLRQLPSTAIDLFKDTIKVYFIVRELYAIAECLNMSQELANRFDRDLSGSEETAERARQARSRGAALGIDWVRVFHIYYAQANLDPKKFIRFPRSQL